MKRIFTLILIAASALGAISFKNIHAQDSTQGTMQDSAQPTAQVTAVSSSQPAGQEKLSFKTKVHDFGQVLISEGPVSCKFVATNDTKEVVAIRSVTTSCGCTSVKWNKDGIQPGAKTEISVTYTNDEGPYPFEKSVTVYVLGQPKPIILQIRGISQNKKLSDAEIYTKVFGSCFAMQQAELKCGNLEQGGSKGDQCTVANLSSKPINVTFSNISEGLSLKITPNPIPAKGHATLYYTVTSRPDKWGWNDYYATPIIDGKTPDGKVPAANATAGSKTNTPAGKVISVRAFTADRFSSLTQEEKSKGSRPFFEESTHSFGHVKQGENVSATFTCQNKGQSTLHIHKVDVDCTPNQVSAFNDIPAGAKGEFTVSINTKNLPKGEALVIVTLTTNSPIRPIVSLFLAGWID